jgi:hypothetical protein
MLFDKPPSFVSKSTNHVVAIKLIRLKYSKKIEKPLGSYHPWVASTCQINVATELFQLVLVAISSFCCHSCKFSLAGCQLLHYTPTGSYQYIHHEEINDHILILLMSEAERILVQILLLQLNSHTQCNNTLCSKQQEFTKIEHTSIAFFHGK